MTSAPQPDTTDSVARSLDIVRIPLGDRAYDIHIGQGLLAASRTWAGTIDPKARALVVTNTTVGPLYAAQLVARLSGDGGFRAVDVLELPDGETYKDWAHLNLIFDRLLAAEADRRTVLFALGGGVVGDMTGFAAACYMRGVPFVQVPTTLLAQVDSSVGGKTAINHPLGKNMIGAFYQPVRVACDLDTLRTLPDRELSAGLAEVIKYGAIMDEPFLGWLEDNMAGLRGRDPDTLRTAVVRCCEFKARVVGEDEREAGLRAILNFGHTFGHAIEAGLGFGTWLHGEAVGCGMVLAADVSVRLGLLARDPADRLARLVEAAGLPVKGPRSMTPARYLELMAVDKKADAGAIQYVLLEGLGRAVVRPAPADVVGQAIAAGTEGAVAP